jgi:hypothetical protein
VLERWSWTNYPQPRAPAPGRVRLRTAPACRGDFLSKLLRMQPPRNHLDTPRYVRVVEPCKTACWMTVRQSPGASGMHRALLDTLQAKPAASASLDAMCMRAPPDESMQPVKDSVNAAVQCIRCLRRMHTVLRIVQRSIGQRVVCR